VGCKACVLPEVFEANALVEEWGNILPQELANLVQSMGMRCNIVLKAAHHIWTATFDIDLTLNLHQGPVILFL